MKIFFFFVGAGATIFGLWKLLGDKINFGVVLAGLWFGSAFMRGFASGASGESLDEDLAGGDLDGNGDYGIGESRGISDGRGTHDSY